MENRMQRIKKLLVWNNVFDGGDGLTSHQLANAIGCTPRTIRNTIDKWGKKYNVHYTLNLHRNSIMKKIYATPDTWLPERLF